ncbi:MAG: ABC transporter permease [Spirochaetes bacterium]|nr:ABC transporter permease [Spirochaetota bacterium]
MSTRSMTNFQDSAAYKIIDRHKKLIIAFLLIVFLFVIGEFTVETFLTLSQVLLTLKLASFIALFALCQMIAIAGGGSGLDLSVGYMATITAVFTAAIMEGRNSHLGVAVLAALGLGLVVGLINGTLTAYLRLPPLVVTLAMANILQGVINVYTAGKNITGRPSPVLQTMAAKSTGIFPNIVFLLLIITPIVMILLYKTKLGLKLFGSGANETAAYLSGVNVKLVRCTSYIISSTLASIIGLLLLGNMGIAFKDMGSNYVMPSIAAVVVGGVSLTGGDGNYIGVILGAIFLQTLTNLLVALGWGDAGKWTGFGIVLFALLILYLSNRRKR